MSQLFPCLDSVLDVWLAIVPFQADLRLVDLRARRRAMEDLYAALQVVKNVHSALIRTLRIRSVLLYRGFSFKVENTLSVTSSISANV